MRLYSSFFSALNGLPRKHGQKTWQCVSHALVCQRETETESETASNGNASWYHQQYRPRREVRALDHLAGRHAVLHIGRVGRKVVELPTHLGRLGLGRYLLRRVDQEARVLVLREHGLERVGRITEPVRRGHGRASRSLATQCHSIYSDDRLSSTVGVGVGVGVGGGDEEILRAFRARRAARSGAESEADGAMKQQEKDVDDRRSARPLSLLRAARCPPCRAKPLRLPNPNPNPNPSIHPIACHDNLPPLLERAYEPPSIPQ